VFDISNLPQLLGPSLNVKINVIYGDTLLHLRDCYCRLDLMTGFETGVRVAAAQPGVAPSALLALGQVPKLLPIIIIQVAVPGPA